MKYFALVLILAALIAGCGTQPIKPHPNVNVPRANIVTMPVVEFVGDETMAGLAAYEQNPQWHCDDCATGNTSAQALAGFPAVLAAHPDVVVITVGSYDVIADYFANEDAEDMTCGEYDDICNNLTAMINQAQNAGAKVIVGTIPPFGAGPAADVYNDCCNDGYEIQNNQLVWDVRLVKAYPKGNAVTLVDFDAALAQQVDETNYSDIIEQYIASYTTDGIAPNAAGYAVIAPLLNTQITALHVGGGPR